MKDGIIFYNNVKWITQVWQKYRMEGEANSESGRR